MTSTTRAARRAWAAARTRPLPAAALLALASLLAVLTTLHPTFETNDDTAMMSMARGEFGYPSARLVFINVLVGGVLRALYTSAPGVAWYALLLYTAQYVALAVLLYVALTHDWERPLLGSGVFVAVLVVFHLQLALFLQFTSTAMLVCLAGVALFCRRLPAGVFGHPGVAVAAGALVGGASLLRFNAMAGVVAAALPFLAAALRHQRVRRTALFGGTAAVVAIGGMTVDAWAYERDPGWAAYRDFNGVRGQLHDSGRLVLDEPMAEALDEIGWHPVDFYLFVQWFFTDEERYTTDALQVLVEASDDRAGPSLGTGLWDLVRPGGPYRPAWARLSRELALAAALLAAGVLGLRGRERWMPAAGAAWVAGLLAYLLLFSRLPNRVGLPLVMTAAVLLTLTWRGRLAGVSWAPGRRLLAAGLVATLALAAGSVGRMALARSEVHRAEQIQLGRIYERLHAFDPDGVYVSWAGGVPLQWLDPFREYRDLPALRRVGLGWPTHSPHHRRLLASAGLDDVYRAVADRDDVYLVTGRPDIVLTLEVYLRQHYGLAGCLRRVLEPGSGRIVWDRLVDFDDLRSSGTEADIERCPGVLDLGDELTEGEA